MPIIQSEMARDMIKDPYIFELSNLKENSVEKDIEDAMLSRVKNLLLEFGNGFSFVRSQYKISTGNNDYYPDLLYKFSKRFSWKLTKIGKSEFFGREFRLKKY